MTDLLCAQAPQPPRRVAVVGGGIAGLSAAWRLARAPGLHVTLFEAEPRFGGHAHTVDVTLPDVHGRRVVHGVDTGFLVFNRRTYPQLLRLFEALDVAVAPSDMSFSVQSLAEGLEWCGSDLGSVFAQRRNLLRPRFLGMLVEILRFNRLATRLATGLATGPAPDGQADRATPAGDPAEPLGDFLDRERFSAAFQRWYLLPMVASIWSCPMAQMRAFPVGTLARFCHNHGLLQVTNRPQWYTVRGGSRRYVDRMLAAVPDRRAATPVSAVLPPPALALRPGQAEHAAAASIAGRGVHLVHAGGREHFDAVVLACHSPQALALLGHAASAEERAVLGAIHTQPNRAVLHTDSRLLPQHPRAWAAWNHEHGAAEGQVCLHYLINRLQPLPFAQPVIVSLNPLREPDPAQVLADLDYAHPVFDVAAVQAQQQLARIQGRRGLWFCGAWTGNGFHEDGHRSGLDAAEGVLHHLQALPAQTEAGAPALVRVA
jgi:predicted NAD/FAD-binding protein